MIETIAAKVKNKISTFIFSALLSLIEPTNNLARINMTKEINGIKIIYNIMTYNRILIIFILVTYANIKNCFKYLLLIKKNYYRHFECLITTIHHSIMTIRLKQLTTL